MISWILDVFLATLDWYKDPSCAWRLWYKNRRVSRWAKRELKKMK